VEIALWIVDVNRTDAITTNRPKRTFLTRSSSGHRHHLNKPRFRALATVAVDSSRLLSFERQTDVHRLEEATDDVRGQELEIRYKLR
jgi:hypothetical protein